MFITLEGPDGGGKSTQAQGLAEHLRRVGYAVTLTREPGGTEIGDQIRDLLHDRQHTEMDARAEILLYSAYAHSTSPNAFARRWPPARS